VFTAISDGRGESLLPGNGPWVCDVHHLLYEPALDTLFRSTHEILLTPRNYALQTVQVLSSAAATPAYMAIKQVELISRQSWQRRGAASVDEALRLSLGTQLSPDLILGTSAGLDGLSASLVMVTIDGIPLTGRMGAGIDLSRLDVDRFERIELVRGPMAVRYGSSAVGGVINLVTRQVDTAQRWQLDADALYSSDGWLNGGLSSSWSLPKGHQVQAGFSRDQFLGWNPKGYEGRDFLWNPKLRYSGFAQYQLQRQQTIFSLRYGGLSEAIDNRGPAREPFFVTAFDDTYQTAQHDFSARLQQQVGACNTLILQAGGGLVDRKKNTYYRDLTTLSSTLVAESGAQDTSSAWQYFGRAGWMTSNKSKSLNLETGISHEYETFTGERIQEGTASAQEWGPYTEATWNPHSRWTTTAGLRYAAHSDFGREWLPALNVRYGSRIGTWRVEYARGFRTPSLKERFFAFIDVNHFIIGNEGLEAERSHYTALDFDRSFSVGAGRAQLRWSAGAHHQWISNGIRLIALDATRYSYGNVDQLEQTSAFTSLDWQREPLSIKLEARVMGWYMLEQYTWQPELGLTMEANLPWQLAILGNVRYVGGLARLVQSGEDSWEWQRTEAYTWVDLGMHRTFFDQLQVSAGMRNLLNVTNLTLSGASSGVHGGGASFAPLSTGRLAFVRCAWTWTKKNGKDEA
jgi:outer membrane receptor for ferrienterochelin and colicins